MNPTTKGNTMNKPSRKTINDIKSTALVVGATATTVVVAMKFNQITRDRNLAKIQLTMAYTLINKVDALHPKALAEAVAACDADLSEYVTNLAK